MVRFILTVAIYSKYNFKNKKDNEKDFYDDGSRSHDINRKCTRFEDF